MKDKIGSVDYQESIAIRVGKFLIANGFGIADDEGVACSLAQASEIGILRKDSEAKPRKYLFGFIVEKPLREFIGVVWFSNRARGANKKKWVFEVYGRKHVELVRQLAEEMASTFSAKIALRLVREQSDVESYELPYPGDWVV